MTTPDPAFAIIDGALCELKQFGVRTVSHAPLATAVAEFHRSDFRTFVREAPFGLLPGFPNLYCLDGDHRLLWIADWPDASDPCAAIVDVSGDEVVVTAQSGAVARFDAASGRLIQWQASVAAVG